MRKFTLIELLIVVAVITIIAAIFVPLLFKVTSSNVKASDVGGWIPLGEFSTVAYGSTTVYWTTNQENGDRIYVMVGSSGRGGICVIPTPKKASSP